MFQVTEPSPVRAPPLAKDEPAASQLPSSKGVPVTVTDLYIGHSITQHLNEDDTVGSVLTWLREHQGVQSSHSFLCL